MTEMVERGGVRVDWFEGRGDTRGGIGGGREGKDEGMEVGSRRRGEEWGRNGQDDDEDEEGRRKKARKGVLTMRGKDEKEKDAENAEDTMLELRLSLAVAISVPSPPSKQELEKQHQSVAPALGSFIAHQHLNNLSPVIHNGNQHHHLQPQQLGAALVGRTLSPVKPLMQLAASPIEKHRDSSRANLGATLKHLVSQQLQQQPVKLKSMPKIPGSAAGTARQPIQPQYGMSALPQLHRPHPPPLVRSSSSQDGVDIGVVHFQGLGRLNTNAAQAVPSSQSSSFPLGQFAKRHQSGLVVNQAQESLFLKGFPHQSQPRIAVQRNFLRNTTAASQQQSTKEVAPHQGQNIGGSVGHSTVLPSSPSSRIFVTNSYSPHISAHSVHLPGGGPQLQAFLQHQPSNSVSVASHRQTQPQTQAESSVVGKNPSAFSVVRPAISETVPSSIGDDPPRDRSGDVQIIVSVCDRKVKLISDVDPTSLYATCRRWVRNDVTRRDHSVSWDCPPLPRPSPAAEPGSSKIQSSENCKKEEAERFTQVNLPRSVETMTEEDLLHHHVEHFKNVRKRFRDNRTQRIARFMSRLALLLPGNIENSRRDAVQCHP